MTSTARAGILVAMDVSELKARVQSQAMRINTLERQVQALHLSVMGMNEWIQSATEILNEISERLIDDEQQ